MTTARYTQKDLAGFVTDVLVALGNPVEMARINADVLVWSDLVGRHNHGVIRLPALVARVRKGLIDLGAEPELTALSPGTERIDARHGLGQYAGHLGAARAIALARDTGIGAVGVCNSNYYGIGACYLHQMALEGMIGVALSSSAPKVAAHRGRDPVMGTNPLAFGVPMPDERTLMVDMSTAGLAGSTVREHAEKGWPLPEGFLIDKTGAPVTDPALASKATLLPAAGAKGFGLGLMVEVLSGVLTGGAISHQVLSIYNDFSGPARSGHFFVALDVRRWMPMEDFHDRMRFLTGVIAAAGGDTRLPGESRWRAAEENTRAGIPVAGDVMERLRDHASDLGVALPPPRAVAGVD
ncbi:Ldh family oxidoreductase [Oceanibium sediminis]|uniref:Ldh family oxidoreductase n=1 Tax=Oceanibium sediminis TaxID=2026339 RepID=UPI000DD46511|nr:Ldh family oxidoreductase [Oceanibium sediminis]